MAMLYGRSEGESRAYGSVKHRPEIKLSLLSGLSTNGLVAPYEFEGYLNQHIFYYYSKNIMLPELKSGQVVVMDNLSSHKGECITKLFDEKGIKIIYLPSYSPDLNPIEKYWAIMKSYLKKWCPRTKEEVKECLTRAIKIIDETPLINIFNDCWNL